MLRLLVAGLACFSLAVSGYGHSNYAPDFTDCNAVTGRGQVATLTCGGSRGKWAMTITPSNDETSCQLDAEAESAWVRSPVTILTLSASSRSGTGTCSLAGHTFLNHVRPGDDVEVDLQATVEDSNSGRVSVNIGDEAVGHAQIVTVRPNNKGAHPINSIQMQTAAQDRLSVGYQLRLKPRWTDASPSHAPSGRPSGKPSGRPVPSASAAAAARRKREQAPVPAADCPYNSVRCPLPGQLSSSAYECLDILTEVNSCGGCVSAGRGVDCEAIEGVRRFGVDCFDGQCVVKSCRRGYRVSADKSTCEKI